MDSAYFMTKEMVKRMMSGTGQELICETPFSLEYGQDFYSESIVYEFGQNGFLIKVHT